MLTYSTTLLVTDNRSILSFSEIYRCSYFLNICQQILNNYEVVGAEFAQHKNIYKQTMITVCQNLILLLLDSQLELHLPASLAFRSDHVTEFWSIEFG